MMRQVGGCDQGPIGRSGTEHRPPLPNRLIGMGVSKTHSLEALCRPDGCAVAYRDYRAVRPAVVQNMPDGLSLSKVQTRIY
jgi:hypothetical protein